jgi:hypothetical protein
MSALTVLGFVAIIIMLVAYILEDRSTVWIFIFATACVASSIYGWLAGTIPFGIVEIIWAAFAYRKWWLAKRRL